MESRRQCVSCGAPVDVGVTKCAYCGMVYEPEYWEGTVRYIPLHTGRKRLRARVMVEDRIMDGTVRNDGIADYVRSGLVHNLAEGLSEMMTIRMNYDPCRMVTIVEGEVWVEDPGHHAEW